MTLPDRGLDSDAADSGARAATRPGDVIISVNIESLHAVNELRTHVRKAGKRITLLIQRSDNRVYVPVEPA